MCNSLSFSLIAHFALQDRYVNLTPAQRMRRAEADAFIMTDGGTSGFNKYSVGSTWLLLRQLHYDLLLAFLD